MNHAKSIAVATLLASATLAQPVTIPSKAAITATGSYFNVYAFFGTSGSTPPSEGHTLCLYDTSDVGAAPFTVATIALRRPPGFGNAAITANLRIVMSMSSTGSSGIVSTFASNHGAAPATVFNAPINLPAVTSQNWPTSFEAPIVLTAPFVYLPISGGSLAIEMITDQNSSATRNVWYVEDYRIEAGTNSQVLYQQNCKHSGGSTIGGWSYDPPKQVVGGTFFYQAYGYPNNLPSFNANFLALGTVGPGGMWGGLTLPFLLSSVLIPSPVPAACQWGIDIVTTVPMTYVTSTSTTPNSGSMRISVPIPSSPSLANAPFFTQIAGIDTNPVTQAPELFPSHAVRWVIGSGITVPGAMVANLGSNASTSGSVLTSEVITFRLN